MQNQQSAIEHRNLFYQLQTPDLPTNLPVEGSNWAVLPEEWNIKLVKGIRRRPNVCTTENYIRNQIPKSVPRNNSYSGIVKDCKKNLLIGESHVRWFKRDKL